MNKYYKQVCIKIATDAQYDSIKPILEKFAQNNTTFDIFIPKHKGNPLNVNAMFNKTHDIVSKDGFSNVIREVTSKNKYHLALITPNYEQGIEAKYYVKYSYGPSHTVKPIFTHQAHRLNHYHGYFLHSQRDLDIFSVFSKTYLLPDLKYVGYKSQIKTQSKKKTILFLPSWEGQNDLSWIVSAVAKLKKNYTIIVKLHPYGDFGAKIPKSVKNVKIEIQKIADEFYDGEASLKGLLARTDLVISDISGAVFDALYVGVPVTIYSKNINKFDVPGVKSGCAKYVDEGYVSLSKTASALVKQVPEALSSQYLHTQKELSKKIFRQDFTSRAVDSWMRIISLYLEDKVDQEYVAMHNLMSSEFWGYKNESERLRIEKQTLIGKVTFMTNELNSFLGIKRSIRLLAGNIKRKLRKTITRIDPS